MKPEAQRILEVFRTRGLGIGAMIHPAEFGDAIIWERGFVRDEPVRQAMEYLFSEGYLVEYSAALELTEKGSAHLCGAGPPNGAGGEVSDESRRMEVLVARVAELELENEALRTEADYLDRQVAELEDELANVSVDAGDDGLEVQVAELEADMDSLNDANAESEAEVESLGQANAELEAALEAATGTTWDDRLGTGSDEEHVYLASKNRRHFHRPGCKWADYITAYLLIEFGSHREAVEAGYRPCKTCRA